jgi:hypothetical protein
MAIEISKESVKYRIRASSTRLASIYNEMFLMLVSFWFSVIYRDLPLAK